MEIGGFGINPIYAGRPAEPRFARCAQINAHVPPGLRPGAAAVRVSYGSQRSEEFTIDLMERRAMVGSRAAFMGAASAATALSPFVLVVQQYDLPALFL